jgi:hypothetical protein
MAPAHSHAGLFAVLLLLALSFASFCDFLSLLVGGLYPAYRSMAALVSGNPEAIKRWLTFWVVAAAFLVPDFLFGLSNMSSFSSFSSRRHLVLMTQISWTTWCPCTRTSSSRSSRGACGPPAPPALSCSSTRSLSFARASQRLLLLPSASPRSAKTVRVRHARSRAVKKANATAGKAVGDFVSAVTESVEGERGSCSLFVCILELLTLAFVSYSFALITRPSPLRLTRREEARLSQTVTTVRRSGFATATAARHHSCH